MQLCMPCNDKMRSNNKGERKRERERECVCVNRNKNYFSAYGTCYNMKKNSSAYGLFLKYIKKKK